VKILPPDFWKENKMLTMAIILVSLASTMGLYCLLNLRGPRVNDNTMDILRAELKKRM
jgi:hypothetical protein